MKIAKILPNVISYNAAMSSCEKGRHSALKLRETGEMEKQRKGQVLISELEHSYHDFAVILHKRLSCTINADWNAEFNLWKQKIISKPIYLILVA